MFYLASLYPDQLPNNPTIFKHALNPLLKRIPFHSIQDSKNVFSDLNVIIDIFNFLLDDFLPV